MCAKEPRLRLKRFPPPAGLDFRIKRISNPEPRDQLARAYPSELPGLLHATIESYDHTVHSGNAKEVD